jgi:Antibiotic biosynthesis monooxygenase
MHGVLRRYTLKPKDVDEVIRRIAEGGVPIIKAIPGFVSYAITDAGNGTLVTYSVYENSAGTEESTKKAASWVKENIASMLPAPPQVFAGVVRVREVKEQPKYGVMRRYQIDPKNMEQIVERAKSGFLPLVNHLPGFASYSILDTGKGTLVTLSGFTTQSGAAESTKAAANFVKENLSGLVPNPPEVTSGEVRVMVRSH